MTLSSMGDVISVTAKFAETVGILWGVYDIRAPLTFQDEKTGHSARDFFFNLILCLRLR